MSIDQDTALASLICERNDHPDAPACDGCYAMAAWLREHGYALAAEADRGTFVQGIRDPKATARSIADAALDAARESAESRPDPKHGPHGNEGYCYCGVFVGHDGDWSSHRADPTPEPDR